MTPSCFCFFRFLRCATDRRRFRKIAKFSEIDDGSLGRSRTPFARFWDPKNRVPGLLFRCFFEIGDFVKIVLPLWWEHDFQGSGPPKIGPGPGPQRRPKKTRSKTDVSRSPGPPRSAPGKSTVAREAHPAPRKFQKGVPGARISQFLGYVFRFVSVFFARGRSGRAPGPISDVFRSISG